MKKIIKYVFISILVFFLVSLGNQEEVYAASADVKITAAETEIVLGEEFNIDINITSDTVFRDVEANMEYNDEILEYIDGASVITGGAGFLRILDRGVSEEGKSRKYSLQFKANNLGSSEIYFLDPIMVYNFEDGKEMSVLSNTLTINVVTAEIASDNTYLKTLEIVPGNLEPGFNKDTFSYEAKVGPDVNQLVLEAIPEDGKSTVNISGNSSFEEGENEVVIAVTAESGDIAEYKINVIKEDQPIDEEEDEEPEDNEDIEEPADENLKVELVDGELIITYEGKTYKIIEPGNNVEIPSGYKKTRINMSGHGVEAYYPEEDINSSIVLIYAMDEQGEADFYSYDMNENTFEKFVPDIGEEIIEEDQDNDSKDNSIRDKVIIFVIILVIIVVIVTIVAIRIHMKNKDY